MQRPCERENRTNKTRSRKHARFCEKADIVISIDPSFTLKKKKKKESTIDRDVRSILPRENSFPRGSKRQDRSDRIREISRVYLHVKGLEEHSPFPPGARKSLLTVARAWFARLRLRSDSLSLLFRPRVFLRLSVRRRPFPPRRRGGEAFAEVKERSRWRGGGGRRSCEIVASGKPTSGFVVLECSLGDRV